MLGHGRPRLKEANHRNPNRLQIENGRQLRKCVEAHNILALGSTPICMLQFVCDYCGNVKAAGETWINGAAAENVGTQAARREVIIDPAWRRERAVLPLAVHFCSLECKDNYLAELFNKPAVLLEVEEAVTEPITGSRIVRAKKKPVKKTAHNRTTVKKSRAR